MPQKKFIFRQLSRYICTRKIQFTLQNLHIVSFSKIDDVIFVVFAGKSLPADSRHSNGYELCPSSRRHLSIFIRSGFHTIFALYGKETFSISVQSHLQVHRWCIVIKQPRIRKLVVIFHHRRPMACLSLNLYDTPGLAPRMNVLFWGPGDFPVSYSNRDTL